MILYMFLLTGIDEQSTQEVKNERFLISTRQTMCEFSAYIVFNKATHGQTDIKHERD